MNSETIALIEKLANKLGTTSEYLWGVLILQAKVGVAEWLARLVIVFFFTVFWYLGNKWAVNHDVDDEFRFPVIWLSGIVLAFCWLGIVFSIDNFLTALLNPEGYALQEILRYIKK